MAKTPLPNPAVQLLRRLRTLYPAVILIGTVGILALGTLLPGGDDAASHPLWKPLLRSHDRLLLSIGEQSLGGVYITSQRLIRQTDAYPQGAAAAAAEAICAYADESSAPVYLLAVPTSAGIYSEELPAGAPQAGEHLLLRGIAAALPENVIWLEAESWLSAEQEQYIYYRTDPCWTGYGAYCVYRPTIRRLGFSAIGYDHFVINHFSDSYRGRLFQQSRYDGIQPDLIDLYSSDSEQPLRSVLAIRADGSTVPLDSYYRREYAAETGNAADVFGILSEPILQIETENQSSKDLLLLTDSFGGSMIPLLLQHYHTVTAVNLTLAADLPWKTLTAGEYAQVLILCGADTLANPQQTAVLNAEEPAGFS